MARYARPGGSSARQGGASRPGTAARPEQTSNTSPQAARRGAPPHTPRALTARFRVPGGSGRSQAAPRDLCTPRKTGRPPSTPPRRLDRSCRGTMIASPFGIHFPARPPFGRCRKVLPPARVPPMVGGSEIPARESRAGSRRLSRAFSSPERAFRPAAGRPRGRFRAEYPVRSRISGDGDGGRETVQVDAVEAERDALGLEQGPLAALGRRAGCVPRMPAAACP